MSTNEAALDWKTLKAGDNRNFPKPGQTVRVHYVGRLMDGSKFDSSRDRGRTFEFVVGTGQVILGWDEILPQMSKGQIIKVVVPPALAYGEHGYPPVIPMHATLDFEIELVSYSSI